MHKLVVLGAGGFANQVFFLTQRLGSYHVIGFLDETVDVTDDVRKREIPVCNDLDYLIRGHTDVFLISAVGDIGLRRRWFSQYASRFPFASLWDPSAIIADDARMQRHGPRPRPS